MEMVTLTIDNKKCECQKVTPSCKRQGKPRSKFPPYVFEGYK